MDERLLRLWQISQAMRHLLVEAEALRVLIIQMLTEAEGWAQDDYDPTELTAISIQACATLKYMGVCKLLVATHEAAEAFDAHYAQQFLVVPRISTKPIPSAGIKRFVEQLVKELADGALCGMRGWRDALQTLRPIIDQLAADRREFESISELHRHYAESGLQWLRRQIAEDEREAAGGGRKNQPRVEGEAAREALDHNGETKPTNGAPKWPADDGLVDQTRSNGEAEPQPSTSTNGATVPKPLKGKYAKALEIIKAKPSRKAVAIANEIGVGVEGFMSRYVPRLREHGVYNDGDGYCWKPPCDSPPSAT